jgi:hypothetical protein
MRLLEVFGDAGVGAVRCEVCIWSQLREEADSELERAGAFLGIGAGEMRAEAPRLVWVAQQVCVGVACQPLSVYIT